MGADHRSAGLLRAGERVFLAIGIIAFCWFAAGHIHAAREQAALSRELEAARRSAEAASGTHAGIRIPEEAPVLATRALIGRIEVPRLRLSALAREGVDVRTLRGSVGHVPGTALPGHAGNAAFAAHRDTFFRPLEGIRKGDTVMVTTPEGTHRYTVFNTRVVDPSNVSVLRSGQLSQLTLVTCYPFDYVGSAPKRFIVEAALAPLARGATATPRTSAGGS
jgi:sortase A